MAVIRKRVEALEWRLRRGTIAPVVWFECLEHPGRYTKDDAAICLGQCVALAEVEARGGSPLIIVYYGEEMTDA